LPSTAYTTISGRVSPIRRAARPSARAAEAEVERAADVGSLVDDPDSRVEVGPAVDDVAVEAQAAGERWRDGAELRADQVTFNCDIATPMLRRDDAVFAVDLWLDVLVRADGMTYGVHDHDDFDEAIEYGWLSEREAAGAREGVRELVELIELLAFLAGVHPFDSAPAPAAPDEQRVPLSAVPLLQPEARASW
jgi:hypothetical protein